MPSPPGAHSWSRAGWQEPVERLNSEIKRRTDVAGIFPNDKSIIRLVGAFMLEQKEEWAVQRIRYITLETISQISNDPSAACQSRRADQSGPAGNV